MTVDGKVLIGRLHNFYLEPTSDLETPTWELYGEIQGVSRSQNRDEAEIKERSLDETTVELGHKNREISLTITRRPGNDQYDSLEAAWESGANIGVAMMTGDITEVGERGYQAEMKVTQWDDDQAHDSGSVSVTLKPSASYETAPEFVEIAGP